jgi:ATP-dependent exoDNAse (exonuclease V) beta subunit
MSDEFDKAARHRALTALDATLLVEAAAGTGKTAIMAGRVTMLLASGVAPRNIAAITFTEFAASELAARVQSYVANLLSGQTPKSMRIALPDGLNATQRQNLIAASAHIDELTASTVHAFCQFLIRDYAVEAEIDPGAQILDRVQMDAAIATVFDRWVKRRLGGSRGADDPVAALSRTDPLGMVERLRELAEFRLKNRNAHPPAQIATERPDQVFKATVDTFRAWFDTQPKQWHAKRLVENLEELANFYEDAFAEPPSFEQLWRMNAPPRVPSMNQDVIELRRPDFKENWDKATANGKGADFSELLGHFDAADRAYRAILGVVSRALGVALSRELDEFVEEYTRFKRNAALLDFQDLLDHAVALVRTSDDARRDIAKRYTYVLVDEFQDTDPVQAEILFSIAADTPASYWLNNSLRPGALFMVGDPKQAIYRFRGADISAYERIRETISAATQDSIVRITANFRSRPGILSFVNACFEEPLQRDGQPGYVALTPTRPEAGRPCVVKLPLGLGPRAYALPTRNAEAKAVAEFCAKTIGVLQIPDEDGDLRPVRAGDIALLAPQHTSLWIYENALAAEGLPFASQAGKGLFRRQEAQDLVALTRALADHRDTLAFGALMRGPLVGLTQNEILDITASLPLDSFGTPSNYTIRTAPAQIAHAEARRIQTILAELRRRARHTTPTQILNAAIERLEIRPILAARGGERSARALANTEAFIELARPYAVKGLKRFAADVSSHWRKAEAFVEGPIDAEGDAIEIVTVHSAKGLQWPVVIPINMVTRVRAIDRFVVADNTIHWIEGGAAAPELMQIFRADGEAAARERLRLWYVACTRAEEVLVLPHIIEPDRRTWAHVVALAHETLPELTLDELTPVAAVEEASANTQTAAVFEQEEKSIAAVSRQSTWLRPSDADGDRLVLVEGVVATEDMCAPETPMLVGAGRIRGLILHKLMEEVLTGESIEEPTALCARAEELLEQLWAEVENPTAARPAPQEMAATVARTLRLPEIAAMRPSLRPECAVYAALDGNRLLGGRGDAIAVAASGVDAVLDWKSDYNPNADTVAEHSAQVRLYMQALNTERGAVVYMTTGNVVWVDATKADPGPPRHL